MPAKDATLLSPDEAADLRAKLAAHEQAEAAAARDEALKPLKPFQDMFLGKKSLTIDEMLAELERAYAAMPAAPNLGVHLHAASVGLRGAIASIRALFEAPPPAKP